MKSENSQNNTFLFKTFRGDNDNRHSLGNNNLQAIFLQNRSNNSTQNRNTSFSPSPFHSINPQPNIFNPHQAPRSPFSPPKTSLPLPSAPHTQNPFINSHSNIFNKGIQSQNYFNGHRNDHYGANTHTLQNFCPNYPANLQGNSQVNNAGVWNCHSGINNNGFNTMNMNANNANNSQHIDWNPNIQNPHITIPCPTP